MNIDPRPVTELFKKFLPSKRVEPIEASAHTTASDQQHREGKQRALEDRVELSKEALEIIKLRHGNVPANPIHEVK